MNPLTKIKLDKLNEQIKELSLQLEETNKELESLISKINEATISYKQKYDELLEMLKSKLGVE